MDLETKILLAFTGVLVCSMALFMFVVTAIIFARAVF